MEIVIILGLIFFNGILSMSEIAMVSARKSRLETAAKKGSKTAKTALRLDTNRDHPDRYSDRFIFGRSFSRGSGPLAGNDRYPPGP